MANVRITRWEPDGAENRIRRSMERKMRAIGLLVQGTAVAKLNRGQPVRRTSGGHLVGLDPSRAGEPPKTLTGRLKQSVGFRIDNTLRRLRLTIGSNVRYAARLELGFHGKDKRGRNINQAARPWLRPSVTENLGKIRSILARDI